MEQLLSAETKSFGSIFSENKKIIVPPYQRAYSWKEQQWEDLWDDIKKTDLTCLIKNKSQGLSIINKRHIWFNFSLDEFLSTDFTDSGSIANLVRIATERSNNSETETNND